MNRKTICISVLMLAVVGCSSQTRVITQGVESVSNATVVERHTPGVLEYTWEEPMVDAVEVPPGLDPEGHYYRPAHQEVVEIRQGRWKFHRPN